MPIMMGMAPMDSSTIGPPMKAVSSRKITRKGRSMQASRLEELKNSRSCSNSRRLLTSAPVDSGLASSRMESTFSTSELERTISALRPATSTKWVRRAESIKLNR